ncbi:MAG: GDSL-type esterase/lipase family protein [Candidatus Ornithospirochaeta sp.]|nr:GDSL-type esterase/lipase family protein [Candidatus Ornithospirochaeta sp.]
MKNILCFGDSNTFGSTTEYPGRYEYEERWTIILGKLLGNGYHVIEEGLGGRTTVFEDPFKPGKCGIKDISNAIQSHKPLDLVIIMLGTNDTKQVYNASAKSIAYGVEMIIDRIRHEDIEMPRILIVSPIHIAPAIGESRFQSYDSSSYEKSLELASWYEKTAERTGSFFLDASLYGRAGSDCLHMTKDSHERLAEALYGKVKEILG